MYILMMITLTGSTDGLGERTCNPKREIEEGASWDEQPARRYLRVLCWSEGAPLLPKGCDPLLKHCSPDNALCQRQQEMGRGGGPWAHLEQLWQPSLGARSRGGWSLCRDGHLASPLQPGMSCNNLDTLMS